MKEQAIQNRYEFIMLFDAETQMVTQMPAICRELTQKQAWDL